MLFSSTSTTLTLGMPSLLSDDLRKTSNLNLWRAAKMPSLLSEDLRKTSNLNLWRAANFKIENQAMKKRFSPRALKYEPSGGGFTDELKKKIHPGIKDMLLSLFSKAYRKQLVKLIMLIDIVAALKATNLTPPEVIQFFTDNAKAIFAIGVVLKVIFLICVSKGEVPKKPQEKPEV